MPANPVVHFEIGCRNLADTKNFYSQLFQWEFNDLFQTNADSTGITGHLVSLGHEPHNYTIFYIQVDDVAAAIKKAESLGGSKIVGPITIPTGTFAWLKDPQGNTIGLWKSKA